MKNYKLYKAFFTGRKIGENHQPYSINTCLMSETDEGAKISLNQKFEAITDLKIIHADEKSNEIFNKVIEVFRLWNNHLPTLRQSDENEPKAQVSVYLWNEGNISNLSVDLNDRLELLFSKTGKAPQFKVRYSGAYMSKKHGYLQAGESIHIGCSIEKTPEQIVKDIKKRIFENHAEAIEKIQSKVKEYISKDRNDDNAYKYLSKHYDFQNNKEAYAGPVKLSINSGYISLSLRQQYFSVENAENAVKIINLLTECLNSINAIEKKEEKAA